MSLLRRMRRRIPRCGGRPYFRPCRRPAEAFFLARKDRAGPLSLIARCGECEKEMDPRDDAIKLTWEQRNRWARVAVVYETMES